MGPPVGVDLDVVDELSQQVFDGGRLAVDYRLVEFRYRLIQAGCGRYLRRELGEARGEFVPVCRQFAASGGQVVDALAADVGVDGTCFECLQVPVDRCRGFADLVFGAGEFRLDAGPFGFRVDESGVQAVEEEAVVGIDATQGGDDRCLEVTGWDARAAAGVVAAGLAGAAGVVPVGAVSAVRADRDVAV